MILPNPANLRETTKFPLTWTLLGLNIFIFFLIFSGSKSTLNMNYLLQEEGLQLTGRLYFQYLQEAPPAQLYAKPEWVRQIRSNNLENLSILGSYALRDGDFLQVAEKLAYHGDSVQIMSWKKEIGGFRDNYREQLMFRFGLSSLAQGPLSWLTYQFSHSNWLHLLSNMLFLLVISAAVEELAGSAVLLFIYVFGGFAGGVSFLLSSGSDAVPMVGASASISALLAFYCVAELRPRIRYFYFISPIPGHYGFIYLPTLLIVPLFLVADVANMWSTPAGMGGGVAYAAHLGGSIFGLIAGAFLRKSVNLTMSARPYEKLNAKI